jgi:hypothetical protein
MVNLRFGIYDLRALGYEGKRSWRGCHLLVVNLVAACARQGRTTIGENLASNVQMCSPAAGVVRAKGDSIARKQTKQPEIISRQD